MYFVCSWPSLESGKTGRAWLMVQSPQLHTSGYDSMRHERYNIIYICVCVHVRRWEIYIFCTWTSFTSWLITCSDWSTPFCHSNSIYMEVPWPFSMPNNVIILWTAVHCSALTQGMANKASITFDRLETALRFCTFCCLIYAIGNAYVALLLWVVGCYGLLLILI